MKFIQIAPDVLSILQKITGFTMKNFVNFDKKVSIKLINSRVTDKVYKLYCGDHEYFYLNNNATFDPSKNNPLVISASDLVNDIGSAIVISEDPLVYSTTVCVGPICAFNRPRADVTPNGYAVDYYQIEISLQPREVVVSYYAYTLHNSLPTYKREYLYEDRYPWWGHILIPETKDIWSRIRKSREDKIDS